MKDIFIVLVFSVLTCVHTANGTQRYTLNHRPYELIIRRNNTAETEKCMVISFGDTQPHKELRTSDYVLEKTPIPQPRGQQLQEVLRIISHDQLTLFRTARSLCPNDIFDSYGSRDTTGSIASQTVFSKEGHRNYAYDNGVDLPNLEVIPLITSGRPDNRVDLAFFSDGYTANEREKFIKDAGRLAKDLSANQTFHTVTPLMNYWAVFTPSKESGVGVGGIPKDTVYGLYRDGTELRGLYSSKPEIALAACASLRDQCNYAILLGNDPLYGGLGGEYTSVTASLANGALVLRHEIGHSIIDVGEEYDGGFAYFGVNSAQDRSSLTWSHWLTKSESKAPPREERSVMAMQAYPWTLLNSATPWTYSFPSSGIYSRYLVKFSLSGIPNKEDLGVLLDGVKLEWTPRKNIGVDRWHYNIQVGKPLKRGIHKIEFKLKNKRTEGIAQLCSVEILEFGTESEFNASSAYYGAFPTFDMNNQTSYRPTYEGCLMRSVAYPNFCKVCLEGLWMSLLKRIDLIDGTRQSCTWQRAPLPDTSAQWRRILELDLVPLAQLRKAPVTTNESYGITWFRNGKEIQGSANRIRVVVDDVPATYDVEVELVTDEVRLDKNGWLTAGRTFTFDSRCGR
ncbi:IgA peptidase M64-domain-containing protein [Hygrophoropsis aurantiaca]|uniref:IgA peptidase M64-domain-containing protein n=1 Tax=Hygrophoropsis aurantiaca TaxID=72124 RepID=A0ACB8AL38_9AGAM|nr:IgA peptidase M64-domain-containing protein [Hygrophoropsis aurantiaca]